MENKKVYWCAEVARLLLVAAFLFSGFVKGIDPVGGAIKIEEYLTAFGMGFLSPISMVLSIGLCSLEFLLGGMLLMGFFKKLTTHLTLWFMVAMTLLTFYLMIFNPVSDCGCFGDALKLTNTQTFLKNVVLLLAAILVVWKHKSLTSVLQSKPARWGLPALLIIGWGVFVYSNLAHLPMLDFRPYKRGASLHALVLTPPGAPEAVREYGFIYANKEGKRDTFSIEELSVLDCDQWTFIDRLEREIHPGYEPPVTDFAIFYGTDEVSERLLLYGGTMVWIITPQWEQVPTKLAPKITALYKAAQNSGTKLYGISASTDEENKAWKDRTKAAYPLLLADAVTIKTMARAKPSVLFLRDGVILDKINARDLPKAEKMEEFLANKISAPALPNAYLERWFLLLLWLVATLLFYIAYAGTTPNRETSTTLKQE